MMLINIVCLAIRHTFRIKTMAERHPVQIANPNQLTEEEREKVQAHLRIMGFKVVLNTVSYPLVFAKTLFQLGYEPYPLSVGRVFFLTGRNAYYLPNVVQYLRNIARDFGGKTLFIGVEAAVVSNIVANSVSIATHIYIDHFFPDTGGEPKNVGKDESELTHADSARVRVRQAIRETIVRTIATIMSRPFTVIMVREIAQVIGGDHKYNGLVNSIFRIGNEEGLSGYFTGLIPNLIADYIMVWGIAALSFTSERLIEIARKENEKEGNTSALESLQSSRKMLKFIFPLVVNSISYPFHVIATNMAVTGSGLAVSLLPYAPMFNHWSDTYNYLKPHGLTRGSRMFLREQKGAISVGPDHQLYASNKHFI